MSEVSNKYKKVIKTLAEQGHKANIDNYLNTRFIENERQKKYKAFEKVVQLQKENDDIKQSYETLISKQQEDDSEIEEIIRNIGRGLSNEEKKQIDAQYQHVFNKDFDTELSEYIQQSETENKDNKKKQRK